VGHVCPVVVMGGYLWVSMCAIRLRGMLGHGKGTKKHIGGRCDQDSHNVCMSKCTQITMLCHGHGWTRFRTGASRAYVSGPKSPNQKRAQQAKTKKGTGMSKRARQKIADAPARMHKCNTTIW